MYTYLCAFCYSQDILPIQSAEKMSTAMTSEAAFRSLLWSLQFYIYKLFAKSEQMNVRLKLLNGLQGHLINLNFDLCEWQENFQGEFSHPVTFEPCEKARSRNRNWNVSTNFIDTRQNQILLKSFQRFSSCYRQKEKQTYGQT